MLAAEQLWTSASDLLKSQVSDGVWQSTFALAAPVELTSERFILGLPNVIIRDKLDGRYRPLVEDAIAEASGQDLAVDFRLVLPTLFDDAGNPRRGLNPGLDGEIDLTTDAFTPGNHPNGMAMGGPPGARGAQPPPGSQGQVGPSPIDRDQAAADQRHRYTFDGFVIGRQTASPTLPPCR